LQNCNRAREFGGVTARRSDTRGIDLNLQADGLIFRPGTLDRKKVSLLLRTTRGAGRVAKHQRHPDAQRFLSVQSGLVTRKCNGWNLSRSQVRKHFRDRIEPAETSCSKLREVECDAMGRKEVPQVMIGRNPGFIPEQEKMRRVWALTRKRPTAIVYLLADQGSFVGRVQSIPQEPITRFVDLLNRPLVVDHPSQRSPSVVGFFDVIDHCTESQIGSRWDYSPESSWKEPLHTREDLQKPCHRIEGPAITPPDQEKVSRARLLKGDYDKAVSIQVFEVSRRVFACRVSPI
jgi:hypothetical protein